MPLVEIRVPAGVRSNGTELESANRWLDANLVRWRDGSIQPIGGWTIRTKTGATVSEVPRGAIGWVDNSFNSNIAIGTANKLFYISSGSVVSDITPAGLATGTEDANLNAGFGGGYYGTGAYGTIRQTTGVYESCTTWSLDTWGEYLVGCASSDGKLYEWQLNTANPAAAITNAPVDCSGLVVTEERFIFALAAGGNPRKVQWCDKEDNTTWAPSATNEAGDFELQTQGEILSGHRLRGRTLIITTTDAHIATYIGPQLVYSFERVGTSCGSISRQACVANQEGAYWMGQNGFFMFNGSSVQEIPCEVFDYVFTDINTSQKSKIWAVLNSKFGEAWWFYPSAGSNEIDRYVVYDYKENHWNIGKMNRSAGFDSGVFRNPIWLDSDGGMYNQEVGFNYGSGLPYLESGPLTIGNEIVKVNNVIPDERSQGEVKLTFKSRLYPNLQERSYGPYSSTRPLSVRFSGRHIKMRIDAEYQIDSGSTLSGLQKASTKFYPYKDLFNVVINGRLLGDLNNDGRVSSADSLVYLKYTQGVSIDPDETDYIENVFHPYILENPVEYAEFITNTNNDWRFGVPKLNVIQGGRR